MINKKQETGAIEVVIEKINVLNSVSTKLPFNIREFQRANESLRMQHRYMDLRFVEMQRNLRTRSEMFMRMREFLVRRAHFVDVETPTLFKATPGVSILKDVTKFLRVVFKNRNVIDTTSFLGGSRICRTNQKSRLVLHLNPKSPTVQTDANGRRNR